MRVVAGNYGCRNLNTLDGKLTRPTGDKVRAAIFSMIGPFFEGGRVLDLYAGSGGLAIEAISRGMSSAVLVERDRKAQAIILDNIEMTKESNKFTLLKMDAKRSLKQLSGPFDLVFLDPPYAKETVQNDISGLDNLQVLSDQVVIVCETDASVELPVVIGAFELIRQKRYGISKVTIYKRGDHD